MTYIPNAAVDGVKFTDSVMLYLLNSIQILRYPFIFAIACFTSDSDSDLNPDPGKIIRNQILETGNV